MKMINRILVAGVSIAAALNGYAQEKSTHVSGLYESYIDYTTNNLAIVSDSKHDKIKLNEFFGSTHVSVIHDSNKQRYEKSKLYGYRNCAGEDYRFYENTKYKIIDTADFYLYSRIVYPTTKGYPQASTIYYFSPTGNDDIVALTIGNLKNAFPSQHEFHYLLDQQFNSNNELDAYDIYLKKYKVKYLFEKANNKQ